MRHTSLTLVLPAILLAGCGDSTGTSGAILLRDNCDPATFNAALGAGTCQRSTIIHGLPLDAFTDTLQTRRTVGAWTIAPITISLKKGTTAVLWNTGGETHSYTEVQEFGGGVVARWNELSGNTAVAPECADSIAARGSTLHAGEVRLHVFDQTGTRKYQCCFHPWMRQTVTIY